LVSISVHCVTRQPQSSTNSTRPVARPARGQVGSGANLVVTNTGLCCFVVTPYSTGGRCSFSSCSTASPVEASVGTHSE
jgi:hypothetical protein